MNLPILIIDLKKIKFELPWMTCQTKRWRHILYYEYINSRMFTSVH